MRLKRTSREIKCCLAVVGPPPSSATGLVLGPPLGDGEPAPPVSLVALYNSGSCSRSRTRGDDGEQATLARIADPQMTAASAFADDASHTTEPPTATHNVRSVRVQWFPS